MRSNWSQPRRTNHALRSNSRNRRPVLEISISGTFTLVTVHTQEYETPKISNLARSAKLPTGLYILLALISYFFLFLILKWFLGYKLSQDPLDRFSQSFHQIKAFWVQMIDPCLFFDISRDLCLIFQFVNGRCHGNQFSGKTGAKLPTPCTYRSVAPIRNGLSLSQCK